MPRTGITIYDLLISCPGDVTEYLEVLKKSVADFNRTFGVLNKIEVVTKHWSTDSYPESGDKPQALLNKQFVRKCDAAVAIFGTRFGTPTDKYASGTEEEIEELLLDGKQVFIYFLDFPVNPSNIDVDQYQKVLNFRKRYEERGMYAVIKDKKDFQRVFSEHLSLYFSRLISGAAHIQNEIPKPILTVRDVNTSSDKYCSLKGRHLLESKFINQQKEKIMKDIEVLNNTVLSTKIKKRTYILKYNSKEEVSALMNLQSAKMGGDINSLKVIIDGIKIDDKWIKTISEFADKHHIKLEDDFWNLGNLQKNSFGLQSTSGIYIGTDEEKNRYSLLGNLYRNIEIYNEYNEFFKCIDSVKLAELMISNLGKTYDEDIDVKLIVPKGYLLQPFDLPYPGMNIIKNLLEIKLVENIFLIEESDTVSKFKFNSSLELNHIRINNIALYQKKSMAERYEDNKKSYRDLLNSIFIYKKFETPENDILMFDIAYLKHNSSRAFPSVLLFKDIPQTLKYEISSKHIPDVIKGELSFNVSVKDPRQSSY